MASGEKIRALLDSVESEGAVTLSPVERLLMATDGTVTHMLEALTRGEVYVKILSREVYGGTLERDVVLRRAQDQSNLVWARSHVNLYPLDVEMEDELVDGSMGIGDLLRAEYEETRREVVEMRAVREGDEELPTFIDGHSHLYLARKYKIHSEGARIMTIWEYFPKGLF